MVAGIRERVFGWMVVPWVVSARSEVALAQQLAALAVVDAHPVDVGWSLVSGRAVLEHRAVRVGGEVVSGLRRLDARVAFVFPGQGSQTVGAGVELGLRFPVFAAAFDEVCGELDRWLPQPLRSVDAQELLDQTVFAQAQLFALGVALVRLAQSFGVSPQVVAGHSVGEITAAHVAGVMSLPDAARLVTARGALMQALPPGGVMLSVAAGVEVVRPFVAAGVEIAAVNSTNRWSCPVTLTR